MKSSPATQISFAQSEYAKKEEEKAHPPGSVSGEDGAGRAVVAPDGGDRAALPQARQARSGRMRAMLAWTSGKT